MVRAPAGPGAQGPCALDTVETESCAENGKWGSMAERHTDADAAPLPQTLAYTLCVGVCLSLCWCCVCWCRGGSCAGGAVWCVRAPC
jgi:hypothetical protein